jgi:hypothetical protein
MQPTARVLETTARDEVVDEFEVERNRALGIAVTTGGFDGGYGPAIADVCTPALAPPGGATLMDAEGPGVSGFPFRGN